MFIGRVLKKNGTDVIHATTTARNHQTMLQLTAPLAFEPIFMERVWGGRKLESFYGKRLPPEKAVGESWEMVDRPEAQSVVRDGPFAGRSLHDLWVNFRDHVFGSVPDSPRFPLLIKLLDCRERLSLQVHPPPHIANQTGGEPKTEAWFIADAAPEAELYLGFREPTEPDRLDSALKAGTTAELVCRVPVKTGDTFLVPSGRMHSIGAGNLIVEVQQNSDTTYRVFDWNRVDEHGRNRDLHVEEAMRCIDFNDSRPSRVAPKGESLISDPLFAMDRWKVGAPRELVAGGEFAIGFCLSGELICAGARFRPGEFFLLPAGADDRLVQSPNPNSELLRITIPE